MSRSPAIWKAITILQPHAWAVIDGQKLFENRTWPSDHTGPLFIHAGMSPKCMSDSNRAMYPGCPDGMQLSFGEIIGVVDMYGSKRPSLADGPYFGFGPWCHVYANARRIARPVECRGQLGLWTVPPKVVAELLRQLPDLAEMEACS